MAFKMAAFCHLNFQILKSFTLQKDDLHQCIKFCQTGQMAEEIAQLSSFQDGSHLNLGFSKI